MKKIYYSLTIALSIFIIVSCSTENTPVYQLTTSISPTEAGTVNPSSAEYDEGEEVQITATPNEHWVFDSWQGGHTGKTNPASITMNSDKDITALFIKKEYPLTLNTEGEGTVSEKVVQAKTTDYESGTTVELTAETSEGWTFSEWKGDIEGDENPATINVDEAKEVTAVFERIDYPLTVNIEGEGTVSEEIVQAKSTDYPYGTTVELTANPADGWVFTQWSEFLEGNENPTTITVEDETQVTSIFKSIDDLLTVVVEGEGGVEIAQESASENPSRTQVELTANASEGWKFVEWLGDIDGTENQKSLTIDSEKSVEAVFERIEYTLNTSVEGEGVIKESLISGTETENGYLFESEVELTAEAANGWEFKEWSSDLEGEQNPLQITVNETLEITAIYQVLPLEIGKTYEGDDGLSVTLNEFEIVEKTGSFQYKISYTLENKTEGKIDEGTFKLFYEGKDGGLQQYGAFGTLFPDDSITRSYTFEEEKDVKFSVLGYHSDIFFADKPPEGALIWNSPS